jgi:hypothetical protein
LFGGIHGTGNLKSVILETCSIRPSVSLSADDLQRVRFSQMQESEDFFVGSIAGE